MAQVQESQIDRLLAENQRLQSEIRVLRERAERDGLTGCLRREAFFDLIDSKKRFGHLSHEMTVAVIDIDHFKKINDTYGHAIGDEALKFVANILREFTPQGGALCRMGGEEFVLLLHGSAQSNQEQLEALRQAIHTHTPPLPQSFGAAQPKISISLGATTWNSDSPLMQAAAEADLLLYRAKNSGRNRLELAPLKAA